MLKPSSFSPILAMIGIILCMSKKSDKKKDIGEILLGFAVLMYGMESMSGAVEPLADVPEFTHILTMFSNPVLGMLAGLSLLWVCDEVWAFGDEITEGMKKEILFAEKLNIKVRYISENDLRKSEVQNDRVKKN